MTHRFLTYFFLLDDPQPYARIVLAADKTATAALWVDDLDQWAVVDMRLPRASEDIEPVIETITEWVEQLDLDQCRSITFSHDLTVEYWEACADDDPQVTAALADLFA